MDFTGIMYFALFVVVETVFETDNAGALQMGNCTDYKRQLVAPGERFTPLGYDACTTCTCEHGRPEMCLSMLCSPPKECKNLIPLDDKCCEFECFDTGKVTPSNVTVADAKDLDSLNATNLGLRLVASTITSFLILALLLFMIHRLRQRRLLLMIRRINGSQVVGIPYGSRRYSLGDDGSVGYLTGRDHVDFPPYDDPPPPYTFWKPPESYFPQEEAPPPYEASNNNNNNCATRNHNALNDGNYHLHMMMTALPLTAPVSLAYPVQSMPPVGYASQLPHYANSPSSQNGLIPSLTQVSLRTNNFQINDLDQEPVGGSQRHYVPVHDLNVVGSITSLNSSQNELNVGGGGGGDANLRAIRSDAVYEEHAAAGMLPPLAANVVGAAVPLAAGVQAELPPPPALGTTKWEEGANLERHGAEASYGAASTAAKCRSCSNVVDCWHDRRARAWDVKARDASKRRSLQPEVQYCPDPTRWAADASETSSSSTSPTFERTTMSPTSSDSSSIDYSYGRHQTVSTAGACCTDDRLDGRKTSLPSLTSGQAAAAAAPPTKSSSLDRTLDTIRAKMSLKRKPGRASKLRRLLTGGSHADLPDGRCCALASEATAPGETACACSELPPVADDCDIPRRMSSSMPCGASDAASEQCAWRTPRILYVSDGDVSLRSLAAGVGAAEKEEGDEEAGDDGRRAAVVVAQRLQALDRDRRHRPHSYDFADLRAVQLLPSAGAATAADDGLGATYSIKEESASVSMDATHSDNPPTTADCCCSLSSDRLGSSLDSFACTCSSRASFGSGSTPSREGPASMGSLCSPMLSDGGRGFASPVVVLARGEPCGEATGVPRSGSASAHAEMGGGEQGVKLGQGSEGSSGPELPAVRTAQSGMARGRDLPVRVVEGASEGRCCSSCADQPGKNCGGPHCSSDGLPASGMVTHVRLCLGNVKGSHESYI